MTGLGRPCRCCRLGTAAARASPAAPAHDPPGAPADLAPASGQEEMDLPEHAGTPTIPDEVRVLVEQLARQNPAGATGASGVSCSDWDTGSARGTIRRILAAAGLEPAPRATGCLTNALAVPAATAPATAPIFTSRHYGYTLAVPAAGPARRLHDGGTKQALPAARTATLRT